MIENGKWVFPTYLTLESAVYRFFQILNEKEYSYNADREFSPVKFETDDKGKTVISSIRVYKTAELNSLLTQMEKMAEEMTK